MQIFDPSITGSLYITGSTIAVGNLTVSGTIFTTNVIKGTASWAENVITASHAITSSYTITSSFASTASYVNPLYQNVIITGSLLVTQSHISTVDYIDFNPNITNPTFLTGRLHWVDDTKTLQIDTDVNGFEIEIGHQNVVRGRNVTGYTLTKGTIVYINGESGNRPTFTTASWEGDPSSASTLGFVAQDINDNQTGYVVTNGILRGLNTNAFAPGTQLYLSSSGQYTSTVPVSPLHEVRLGKTITQATDGYIYVDIMNGYEIGELHDVLIVSKSSGDLLVYDSASRVWKNTKVLSGSYSLSGSLTTNDGVSVQSLTASFVSASSITGSLLGTASYVNQSLSSSYALTASYALNGGGGSSPITIADEGTAQGTATFLNFTGTGVSVSVTSNTASINIPGAGGSAFPYTGSAIITGSLIITGSTTSTLGFTGSLLGTASWAENVISSSFASTSSYTIDQGAYYPGIISGSSGWSQTGTGQVNLPNVTVGLYDNPNFYAPLKLYSVTGGTTGTGGIPSLIDNTTNFIFIKYNGGSPVYDVTLNFNDVTNSDSVMFIIVYRLGNFVHTLEFGDYGAGLAMKSAERTVRTDRFARESGLQLSLDTLTGVATVASGTAWNGPYRQNLDQVNSQTDIFFKNYHSASVWTYTTSGDFINISVFDNGITTQSVDPGKYLTNWYYRGQEVNDHIYEVFSTDQYDSITQAEQAIEPELPTLVSSHAFLVGRIIVQSGSYSSGIVQSAFARVFPSLGIVVHNELVDLQGGNGTDQYYHLTQTQFNNIALQNTNGQSLTGSFSGSLIGTASWAENAITASYALTAQTLLGSVTSASYAETASYVKNAQTASFVATASWARNAITASYVIQVTSASYATTASYINGLITKNNAITAGTFIGNPRKVTVTFTTPFPNANYSVVVTGEDSRTWTIESKVSGSFIINSNSNISLTGNTYWQAMSYGEYNS